MCVLREASFSVEVGLPSRALPTQSSPHFCPPQVWSFLAGTPRLHKFNFHEAQQACEAGRGGGLLRAAVPGLGGGPGLVQRAGCRAPRCSTYPVTQAERPCGLGLAPGVRPLRPARHRRLHRYDVFCLAVALRGEWTGQAWAAGGRAASGGPSVLSARPCWHFQLKPCPTEVPRCCASPIIGLVNHPIPGGPTRCWVIMNPDKTQSALTKGAHFMGRYLDKNRSVQCHIPAWHLVGAQ